MNCYEFSSVSLFVIFTGLWRRSSSYCTSILSTAGPMKSTWDWVSYSRSPESWNLHWSIFSSPWSIRLSVLLRVTTVLKLPFITISYSPFCIQWIYGIPKQSWKYSWLLREERFFFLGSISYLSLTFFYYQSNIWVLNLNVVGWKREKKKQDNTEIF